MQSYADHPFRVVICQNCGYTANVPIYCGNRFCNVCSAPRLKRVRNRLVSLVSQVPFVKGCDFKHLTLTIPNRQDLPRMLTHLISSFKRLRRSSLWRRHFVGGAFVIEVTGEPGSWHAHLHCVCQCSWVPWNELLKAWVKASHGRGVFIQRIPKSAIIAYLTKYMSKCSVSDEHLESIGSTLKGYRLFQTFGTWHSIKYFATKKPYPCPKCKVCAWMPYDIFHADLHNKYGYRPP